MSCRQVLLPYQRCENLVCPRFELRPSNLLPRIAALVPAILYYLALFLQVDFLARRFHLGDSSNAPTNNVRDVFKSGWLLPIPFAVLIIALFQFNLSPEVAVLVSLLVLIILSFIRRDPEQRMTPLRIVADLIATGRSVAGLILVTAIAGMIIGILSNTGLSFSLGFVLLGFGENTLAGLLLITAAVCIVLGMGLPTTGVYLLLATLAARGIGRFCCGKSRGCTTNAYRL